MFGWLRPLRKEAWQIVPDWRDWHRFMSNQAMALGSMALTVAIALDAERWVLLTILGLTAVATMIGTLIEQPEVHRDR